MFPGTGPSLGVERSLALYDGEIRRTDDAIGELLERIDRSVGPASTTIVLTADHGDEFLERGS
jgi:arylsulfatase A-like enzyme